MRVAYLKNQTQADAFLGLLFASLCVCVFALGCTKTQSPDVHLPDVEVLNTGDLDALDDIRLLHSGPLPKGEGLKRLGQALERKVRFVKVKRSEVFTALREGRGDVVIDRIFKVPQKDIAFTAPKQVISFVLASTDKSARKDELSERVVHVSSKAHLLLVNPLAKQVVLHQTPVGVAQALQVSADDVGVFDADTFAPESIEFQNIHRLETLKDNVHIVWALRKSAPQLLKSVDAFLTARALTPHKNEIFKGDLSGMKKRGSIRVLTRNNAVTYFLHKGNAYGFDTDLIKRFARTQGLRVEIVIPKNAADLMALLHEGKGDVIAADFSVTPERKALVDFSLPYLYVNEMLVKHKDDALKAPEGLKGKTIHVRAASSYRSTLEKLQERYGFTISFVDESLETEIILRKIEEGEFQYTLADDNILKVEQSYGRAVEAAFAMTHAPKGALDLLNKKRKGAREIAFAMRQNSPELKRALDRFVRNTYRGVEYNILKRRYFDTRRVQRSDKIAVKEGDKTLSPFDDIIKKYATQYGLDWRLLAALAYQESRFKPNAKSWVGALGLFQVMPSTGAEMGFHRLRDVEQSTHAGVRYLAKLIGEFDESLDYRQRVRFALASYNAGRGHVDDARILAKAQGLDPDRWFQNVEKAMLLLQTPEHASRARHGYCRGVEPVRYVSEIQSRYDVYSRLIP